MKVLLTGATGFIGQAVAEALLAEGHHLVCVLRDPARLRFSAQGAQSAQVPQGRVESIVLDFSKALSPADWRAALQGVEVVVNTVGIFKETQGRSCQPGQSFDVLHTRAPMALFDAAAVAGVRLIVQVSALGADAGAQSALHVSKRAADEHLRRLGVPALIAQPSLVYGPGGASAALFNTLAALPVLVLPRLPPPGVQPVLLHDVVSGVLKTLETLEAAHSNSAPACRTIAFVGPEAMPMSVYLARLRQALGWHRPARLVTLALPWVQAVARAAQRLPRAFAASLVDPEALSMLARGNAADPGPFARLLGRAPQPVEAFIEPRHASALRHRALLAIWRPVLRWSVALVWLWTGIVSLGLYPVQDSLALLGRVGAQGALAVLLLYGAALLDLALGVLTLAMPRLPPRWRGPMWAAQIVLIAGYTALISWRLPEFWLHPYGPLLKNLPMLAVIGLLWSLEPPDPPHTLKRP